MTRIDLPYTKPPLSLNDRLHWATKARLVSRIRTYVDVESTCTRLPKAESAVITLHYRPRDRRRRDKDNLFATLKPCIDGLVDAGVLPADHGNHVDPRVELHEPEKGQPGALWLTVEPVQKWGGP